MARLAAITATLVTGCASAPRDHAERPVVSHPPERSMHLAVRPVFDTGPSWWTDPDKECPKWSEALPIARQMAGCSTDYVGDPAHKCQALIRKCSPGCDVCRSLKPGQGPDAEFGSVLQPRGETAYATTSGPYLFGGYDTRFDQVHVCADAVLLAKVMLHESTHACRAAGGAVDIYDHGDVFDRGEEGCHAEEIAPVREGKECGDPP
jgi:hypothetical protein